MHSDTQRPLTQQHIAGIGVDTVGIDRFEQQMLRTPRLSERLFTPKEQELPIRSLAVRFAAKEALIKALGGSDGVWWQDLEVVRSNRQAPNFTATEGLTSLLHSRGLNWPHLSMTHDGGVATAFVVLEFFRK